MRRQENSYLIGSGEIVSEEIHILRIGVYRVVSRSARGCAFARVDHFAGKIPVLDSVFVKA